MKYPECCLSNMGNLLLIHSLQNLIKFAVCVKKMQNNFKTLNNFKNITNYLKDNYNTNKFTVILTELQ